jgi:hypothetical protein
MDGMDMLDQELLIELQEYIEKHSEEPDYAVYGPTILKEALDTELENYIKNNRKPTFNQLLFSLIDKKGARDSDVYKRAGIDRRHFSKIRNPNYRPGKNTVVALALALELNKRETDELLAAAGYSLSESDTSDLIILFFLEKKIYDIDSVNQGLYYFSQKPLV